MPAAEAGGDLHHHGPVRAEPDLGVRRAVADADRLDRRQRDVDRATRITGSVGQTWASATPKAGGSAVSRSVTVSGTKSPSTRERVHRDLGPLDVLLDEDAAAARLHRRRLERSREVLAAPDEREAALPLAIRRLDDAREPAASRPAGTRAGAGHRRRRTRRAGGASTSQPRRRSGRSDARCPSARRRALRCATVQSAPGETIPSTSRARRKPLDAVLVLRREHRSLVGEREAGRQRIAVDGDHLQVAACPGGLEQPELGRARA